MKLTRDELVIIIQNTLRSEGYVLGSEINEKLADRIIEEEDNHQEKSEDDFDIDEFLDFMKK